MPGAQRNDLDRELDLSFLVNLACQMGAAFTNDHGAHQLNLMRATKAREHALAMGGTAAEADEAAEKSKLSANMIYKQIQMAKAKVQDENRSGMALFLHAQFDDIAAEIDDSYKVCEMIMEDLVASRNVTQRMTRGRFRDQEGQATFSAAGTEMLAIVQSLGIKGTEEGDRIAQLVSETMAQPPVEPVDLVTVSKKSGASASYYSRIVAERGIRRLLRKDQRELFFGRGIIDDVEEFSGTTKEHAIEVLGEEFRSLLAAQVAGDGFMTPELSKLHKERTAILIGQVRAVSELEKISGNGDQDGGFDFQVWELDPKTKTKKPAVIFPESGNP